jgi:MFS family permease
MVQLSSIAGSLIAWYTSDKLGRVRASQIACLFWILGTVIWMASPYAGDKVGTLYAGRFICGLGVGGTVVAAPAYLSEVAPKSE